MQQSNFSTVSDGQFLYSKVLFVCIIHEEIYFVEVRILPTISLEHHIGYSDISDITYDVL